MVQLFLVGGAIIAGIIIISALLKVIGIGIMIGTWILSGYIAGELVGVKNDPITNAVLGLAGGVVGGLLLAVLGLGGITHMALVGKIIAGVVGGVILIYAFGLKDKKNA